MRTIKQLSKPLAAFTTFALLYLILAITLPPNTPTAQQYNLSASEYHILMILVSLPLLVAWYSAFYGYGRLSEYVSLVHRSPTGKPLTHITAGLKVLAWGLPITSILSNLLGGIVHGHPRFAPTAFILIHYASLLVALLAFTLISRGSRGLSDTIKLRPSLYSTRWIMLLFTALGVTYSYVLIRAAETKSNAFYLPMWLILLTIVIPYLYAWFMGLFAAYEIFLYSKHSKGLLYRRSLGLLGSGIGITIITSVIFQSLQSDTTRLRRISLSWLFVAVYLLLLLYATGFLMISRGANRLKRIEEV